jgi:glucosamine--fructose-6-phosphate aminotransferase (isomerizing)
MCGIIGYTGEEPAAPILLDGLSKLEYRGYDSAGVAVFADNKIDVVKSKGRLSVLYDLLDGGKKLSGHVGIGHTRWATHGKPSDLNAHPHTSNSGRIAVVHNGIIENYQRIKDFLTKKGV